MERLEPQGETVEPVDGVRIVPLTSGERMSVQAFAIEPGVVVPEHEHHHEQSGVVCAGELTFELAAESIAVGAGEAFHIPGGQPHAARNTGEVVVRGFDVFSPPRSPAYWED